MYVWKPRCVLYKGSLPHENEMLCFGATFSACIVKCSSCGATLTIYCNIVTPPSSNVSDNIYMPQSCDQCFVVVTVVCGPLSTTLVRVRFIVISYCYEELDPAITNLTFY